MPNDKLTKTVDDIEVTVNPRVFVDMRFMRQMTQLRKLQKVKEDAEKNDDQEALEQASVDFMDAIESISTDVFGDELDKVQDALREKNGGYLSYDEWIDFFLDVTKAYQKNPDAHPVPQHK